MRIFLALFSIPPRLRFHAAHGAPAAICVRKSQRLGNLARRNGEHAEAIRCYDRALADVAGLVWKCRAVGVDMEVSMKKARVALLTNRAQSHLAMSHLDEAASDARAALSADKGQRIARLCIVAVKKQELEDARDWRPQKHKNAPRPPTRTHRRQRRIGGSSSNSSGSPVAAAAAPDSARAASPLEPYRVPRTQRGKAALRPPPALNRDLSVQGVVSARRRRGSSRVQVPTDDFDLHI